MRAVAALVLAAVLAAAPPARGGPDGHAPSSGIRILTTVFPLQQFAAEVAGDRGRADLLLPPGAGVHTWQPRPADIARLADCDLLVFIGSGLEPWLPDLLRAFPKGRVRTLEAAAGLAVAGPEHDEGADPDHEHGLLDPHVWLDFEIDTRIVQRIAEELARIDPSGRPAYEANAAVLTNRLRRLDEDFRTGLAACRGQDLVLAGHGAFGYLARRYGFVQTALYGLSPDAQPKPRDLMRAVDFCRAKGIRTVFSENSVPPDLARSLAREIGGRVLVLYAGHNLTRDQQTRGVGFFDLMRETLAALRDGLECR